MVSCDVQGGAHWQDGACQNVLEVQVHQSQAAQGVSPGQGLLLCAWNMLKGASQPTRRVLPSRQMINQQHPKAAKSRVSSTLVLLSTSLHGWWLNSMGVLMHGISFLPVMGLGL